MKQVLEKTEKAVDSRSYVKALAVLLSLFVLRVIAQLFVSTGTVPFLPSMSEWQSGLLPYPALLFFQCLIVLLFSKVILDFKTASGYFVAERAWLGRPLMIFGRVYLASMVARYVIYMAIFAEARWLHGTIPIVFHMVLALFLIMVSRFHVDRLRYRY